MIITDITNLSAGSHKIIEATCDLGISNKCKRTIKNSYKDMLRYMNNNEGKTICLYCSRTSKFSGRSNPNTRYYFDDNLLSKIDKPIKAYFLGWVASDGSIKNKGNQISIRINEIDHDIFVEIRNKLSSKLPLPICKNGMSNWNISSIQMSTDICNHLQIVPGKKDKTVSICKLSDELMWNFLRGYFDGDGHIRKYDNYKYPSDIGVSITTQSMQLRNVICKFLNKQHIKSWNYSRGSIEISSVHAVRFLHKLYSYDEPKLQRKYHEYLKWLNGKSIRGYDKYGNKFNGT